MDDIAIQTFELGKRYRIGVSARSGDNLRETLESWIRAPFERWKRLSGRAEIEEESFWALRDISIKVKSGTVLGVIGRNGAGKSTLLKLLSRITKPSSGSAVINGRVGSLLEVGTGFHPELTGRENIFLQGSVQGMTSAETKRKFDQIVDFAGGEVTRFLETPVKRYSSGMFVRLAFAVAAHLEPEILLVDEVLSVGDAEFQARCLGKMQEVTGQGRTVLFVSHNLTSIRRLCDECILLDAGRIVKRGPADVVVDDYWSSISTAAASRTDLSSHPREAGMRPTISECWVEDESGERITQAPMGGAIRICFRFKADRIIGKPIFGFVVMDRAGQRIFGLNNDFGPSKGIEPTREGIAVCSINELPLLPGPYYLRLSVVDWKNWVDLVDPVEGFTVTERDVMGTGKVPLPHTGRVFVKGEVSLEQDPTT